MFGPVRKPHVELVIVHTGGCRISVDGHEGRLIEGYAALVSSRQNLVYRYRKDADSLVSWCEAESPLSTGLADRIASCPLSLPVSRRLLELLKIAVDLEDGDGEAYLELSRSLGETLFREYLYQAERAKLERPIHSAVLRAKSYIEENYAQSCNLTQIASVAHVTPQYLTRLFRLHFRETAIQYLWSLRTKRGAQYLRRSGLTVAEIAYVCGFENPNHFSRRIRDQFGVSPSELRRRRWEEYSSTEYDQH